MRVFGFPSLGNYLDPQGVDDNVLTLLAAEGASPLLDLACLVGCGPRLQVEAVQVVALLAASWRVHGQLGQGTLDEHAHVLVGQLHVVVLFWLHYLEGPGHGHLDGLSLVDLDLFAPLLRFLLVHQHDEAHLDVVVVLLDDLDCVATAGHQSGHVEWLVLSLPSAGVLGWLGQGLQLLAVEAQPAVLGPAVLLALRIQPDAPHLHLECPSRCLDALQCRSIHVEELRAVVRSCRNFVHWAKSFDRII